MASNSALSSEFDVKPGGCVSEGGERPKKLRKLRPLVDRVLVRVLPQKEVIVNGILLPETAVEKPQEGEVVAVGNGAVREGRRVPLDVKVGQTVVFGKFMGNEVEVMDEKLLLLREDELMGVYES
jgi:chaperonin GroES